MEETKNNYLKFLCKLLTGEDDPKFLTDRERLIIRRFEKEYILLLDKEQDALERLAQSTNKNKLLREANRELLKFAQDFISEWKGAASFPYALFESAESAIKKATE